MNPIYEHINHGIKNSYGVVIEFAKTNTNTNYMFDIAYQHYQKSNYITHIHRKQFFINGVAPKKPLDVLALQCANLMYPLQFVTTPLGALKALHNFEEIQARFNQELPQIQQEFKGEVTDAYFTQITQAVNDATVFEKRLQNDIVYAVFFHNFYILYEREQKITDYEISIPIQPYKKPVLFTGTQTVVEKDKKYTLEFLGEDTQGNTLYMMHRIYVVDLTVTKISMQYNKGKEDAIHLTVNELKERKQKDTPFVNTLIKHAEKMEDLQPKKKWFDYLTQKQE